MIPLPDHPTMPTPRIGVLLTNLGTPDAADARAVRRYLKEFLSDRRAVEPSQLLGQPILRGASPIGVCAARRARRWRRRGWRAG